LRYVLIFCGLVSIAGITHSVWVNREKTSEAFGPVVNRIVDTSQQIVTEAKTVYESKKIEMENAGKPSKQPSNLNPATASAPVALSVDWRAHLYIEQGLEPGGFTPYVLDRYVVNEQTGGNSVFLVLKTPSNGQPLEPVQKVAQKWFCEKMNSLGIAPQDKPAVALELQSNFGEVLDSTQFSVMNC